jgi:two-component system response regulator LytT
MIFCSYSLTLCVIKAAARIHILLAEEDQPAQLGINTVSDLIFINIQLAAGLRFDVFKQLRIQSPIIFRSVCDQYTLKAFKVNRIDYLLDRR